MILTTISAIHLRYTPETTMASTSTPNPAYSVPAFNGREHLVCIHQEITDFLCYQSHIRLATTSSLLPGTRAAHQQEWEAIIEFLKEERSHIWTLQALDMAENNDTELQGLYEDSPVTTDADGEHLHGDLCRNGKTRHRHDHQLANGSSSVPHSKRHHSYNPHAEESDYDDHETPEIGNIHGDEVYNNID
jgi:hypothetical protein